VPVTVKDRWCVKPIQVSFSFSLQTLNLARDGESLNASANVMLSVILCLLAVWFGQVIARMINR
jgi:CrcB protein